MSMSKGMKNIEYQRERASTFVGSDTVLIHCEYIAASEHANMGSISRRAGTVARSHQGCSANVAQNFRYFT
jgi:hypothetical protein